MSDTYLYRQAIPEQAQTRNTNQVRRELSKLAGLEGTATVEGLGVDPGDYILEGEYRGKYAALMVQELEELFSAGKYDTVPYYAQDGSLREAGYYALANVDTSPSDPRRDSVQEFDGGLTKEGTRQSHRRRLTVNPLEIPGSGQRNDFGNAEECLVAIPSDADKRTWFETESKAREPVAVAETVQVEGVDGSLDVDLVDAYAVGLPAKFELVYDVDYDLDGQADVVLWDDHDRAKIDDAGVNSWQWVFDTDHEYRGVPVVDTGRLRLYLDTLGGLAAETWDASTTSWTSVSLPMSDWTLHDVDVTTISPVKVEAQVVFRDPTQSPAGEFALNLIARRGRGVAHWLVPASVSDPTPPGLVDKLDPIADEAIVRGQESLGLIDRSEVRR